MRLTTKLLLISSFCSLAFGFTPLEGGIGGKTAVSSSRLRDKPDPLDELSDERKANLFQFLLRDLQVEEVPLLAVDSDQVHTLQAAMWTTMAQISDQPTAQKACLVFEEIPIPALRSFVEDFTILKTQERLVKYFPELERFSISLVGKGVGPAILIEVGNSTSTVELPQVQLDEHRNTAAMKMFVDRMVEGKQLASTNGIVYRVCQFSEVCHILSSFWNNVCELLGNPTQATFLSLPALDDKGRFGAVSELLSRSLCLYRVDSELELLHVHPEYSRENIYPSEKPAHGHLPPMSYVVPMLKEQGTTEVCADPAILNFLRRSPVPAVGIFPVDRLHANDGEVNLELENGEKVIASGIQAYSKALVDLESQGEDELKAALETELDIVR